MKHNHSCECEHKEVRYCKKCKVVHCLGCNQEWSPKGIWTWTQPYYYYYNGYNKYNEIPMTTTTSTYGQFVGSSQAQGSTLTTAQLGDIQNSISCKHEA